MIYQLLREWPPGYGGIERVAHELASTLGGTVWSFDVQSNSSKHSDPLTVEYCRQRIPCFNPFGRFFIPLPSSYVLKLLLSPVPLVGHLPSPGVLFLLICAKLLRPSRDVIVYWHSFLSPSRSFQGFLFSVYQSFALFLAPFFSFVITTSPSLSNCLVQSGCDPRKTIIIPCCLNSFQEDLALSFDVSFSSADSPLSLLYIGRLDSYKRLDWLLYALCHLSSPWKLSVVGDGPNRSVLEALSKTLSFSKDQVVFHGRLPESSKYQLIRDADLLVLPSDSCNEAFGIVQLEAMASGCLSLAFDLDRSGMGWVCDLPSLKWSRSQDGLPDILHRLASNRTLLYLSCTEARHRYLELFSRSVWKQHLRLFVARLKTSII